MGRENAIRQTKDLTGKKNGSFKTDKVQNPKILLVHPGNHTEILLSKNIPPVFNSELKSIIKSINAIGANTYREHVFSENF